MSGPVAVFLIKPTGAMREIEPGWESPVYINEKTGVEMALRDAPPGACYVVDDPHIDGKDSFLGPDGRVLEVKLPNGSWWRTDMRASNCTLPDDNAHRCWVRHGKPEDGTLHIDKKGATCKAGQGSLLCHEIKGREGKVIRAGWHGYLHNGKLVNC